MLEVPHHLGTIWNDRDLRHVRQVSSHRPRSNSRASTALAVTVPAAPPKTVSTQPRTPLIDSQSRPVGTAAEQEAVRQILKKYELPDSEGVEIVSIPRDDRKLCPKCHHPMPKDASVCYHCQRNERHPRTR